eukprot:5491450-Amphidinium_carterae.1
MRRKSKFQDILKQLAWSFQRRWHECFQSAHNTSDSKTMSNVILKPSQHFISTFVGCVWHQDFTPCHNFEVP